MTYQELPVRGPLAELVVCTWVDPARADRQAVLPDACIDLVWDGTTLHVAGPDTAPKAVPGQGSYVGIRFRPGAAVRLLDVPTVELVDRRVPLAELWGGAADELGARLADVSAEEQPALLEHALGQRLASLSPADPLVQAVVQRTLVGLPRPAGVEHLARSLGVNERTLRRRCLVALGYGPKTLDRILRFRRALALARSARPTGLADVALGAGYADQAHLARECHVLGGTTPSQLLDRRVRRLSDNGLG